MNAFSPNAQSVFPDGGPVWSQVRAWGTQVEQALAAAAGFTVTNADYTVQVADQEYVIAYAGNTFHTLTVGSPGGYSTLHNNVIVNLSSRGWRQAINGFAGDNPDGSFILWPGQAYQLARQGGAWQVLFRPRRWKITGSGPKLFVAPPGTSSANDNNDGLGSDAPLTTMVSAIVRLAANQIDFDFEAATCLTVQMMDGTHTAGLHLPSFVGTAAGNNAVIIQGNGSNANAVTIADPANPAFALFNKAWVVLQNMVLGGAGGILAQNQALARLGPGMTFAASTGAQIFLNLGGRCIPEQNYAITGGATYHLQCIGYGDYNPDASIQVACSAVTFSQFFAYLQTFSSGNFNPVTFTGAGSVSGARYQVIQKSVLQTPGGSGLGTDFPGSTGGSVDASSVLI